jgi:hypothetical protein
MKQFYIILSTICTFAAMDFIYSGEFPPRRWEDGELLAVLPILEFAAKHTSKQMEYTGINRIHGMKAKKSPENNFLA